MVKNPRLADSGFLSVSRGFFCRCPVLRPNIGPLVSTAIPAHHVSDGAFLRHPPNLLIIIRQLLALEHKVYEEFGGSGEWEGAVVGGNEFTDWEFFLGVKDD